MSKWGQGAEWSPDLDGNLAWLRMSHTDLDEKRMSTHSGIHEDCRRLFYKSCLWASGVRACYAVRLFEARTFATILAILASGARACYAVLLFEARTFVIHLGTGGWQARGPPTWSKWLYVYMRVLLLGMCTVEWRGNNCHVALPTSQESTASVQDC